MKRPTGLVLVVACLAAVSCRAFAADTAPPDQREIEIQTEQGPVKGKIVSPPASIEKPEDIGKRVHPPLRVFVPDRPVSPPAAPNSGKGN